MIAKKKLVNNTYYLFDVSGVAEYDPNVILARLSKTSPERVGKLWYVPPMALPCWAATRADSLPLPGAV
jgi:hypothetical protein